MNELTRHRLRGSDRCFRDGEVSALSRIGRQRAYFQAGYYAVLAALEREDSEVIRRCGGWDFETILRVAGKRLALDPADVARGIELAEASHSMLADEPTESELTEAREWAERIRAHVQGWLNHLPTDTLVNA